MKILKATTLTFALLMGTNPSFTAEKAKQPIEVELGASLEEIISLAPKLYTQACEMPGSTKAKANAFGIVVQLMDQSIPRLTKPTDHEAALVLKELRALSLRQQGACLHNILCVQKKMNAEQIAMFLDATNILRKSCLLYQEINLEEDYLVARGFLGDCLNAFSSAATVFADSDEIEDDVALTYFTEAAKSILESIEINPTLEKMDHQFATLAIAVHKVLRMYFRTNSCFLELSASPERTMKHCKALIDNGNFTKRLIDFVSTYLLDSALDFHLVSTSPQQKPQPQQSKKKASRKKGTYTSPTLSNVAPVLRSVEFVKLPWTTYCGALKAASVTCASLAEKASGQMSELYQQKTTALCQDALKAFEENIYQGEYGNTPDLKERFILAQLEDLRGNSLPLADFYRDLRQFKKEQKHQKRLQQIKAELEHRKQEAEKRDADEERRKAEAEKARTRKKTDTVREDSAGPQYYGTDSGRTPSPELPVKTKVKTRGIADPQYAVAPEEAEALKEPRQLIALAPAHHHVFEAITGQDLDRNITLNEVVKLLTSLGCEIRGGKGSHRVATAPNGQIWTIPGDWNPPIPHYYRQQLNDFLQNKMDIDPDDVVKK